MQSLFLAVSILLLCLLVGGLFLLFRRTGRVEKVMVTQLLATVCVAMLLTLGEAVGQTALYDVALVIALLAVITTLAFVRMGWPGGEGEGS